MGRTHAEVFSQDSRVRLVAVTDRDEARCAQTAGAYGARHEPDLETLLAGGIDLLIVATPNRYHAEASLMALERGVGVFCEKPMATTMEQARAVRHAADRPGAFFAIGHNRRHAPVYKR